MESLEQTTSRWGLFSWFPEHGTEMIHPDDAAAMTALSPNGKVFELVGVDGEYLILAYGEHKFRVTPELFREVNAPSKQIGDVVEVESKGQIVRGVVVEIQWHHQKNEPFYFIEKEGKRSSKRYWGSDFR